MASPSKLLLSLFSALIILLIPLISLYNNGFSIFIITKPFSHLPSFHAKQEGHHETRNQPLLSNWITPFIGFKNISSFSRAISLDVSKCFPVDLPPHAITSTNCCPTLPSPFKFKDFNNDFVSSNTPLRIRKPAHLLEEEFIAKFEKGIALMKALPNDDPRSFYQQSKIHCAYCNGAYHQQPPFEDIKVDIHRSWLFFPIHRWYIYFFERILGNLIGDPTFALPFWNWDSIEGMHIPSMPSCFTSTNSSLYDKLRNKNHMPPHVIDLDYNEKENFVPYPKQVSFNLATMNKAMVLASTKELFMGSPLRLGDESHPGLGSVESAPHNPVHTWVGSVDTPNYEDMGTFYVAARDPIFYSLHANVDRMWVIWKTLGDGRRDYSDDLDWLESNFFFYDENANLVRVKIRDCLDTTKLGYTYQDVNLPWLKSPPTSQRMSKLSRDEKRAKVLGSKVTKFPLVLDTIKSTIVKRPKRLRSKEEKEQEEEVLVIEGIEFGSDISIKFDVHIDDDEDMLSSPDQSEFVGSFVSLHNGHVGNIKTRFKLGISKVLESLGADQDDDILVTLVPKVGKGEVKIWSIKVEHISKY